MTIDDKSSIKIQTVVMGVLLVTRSHSGFELTVTHNFTDVLQNEGVLFDLVFRLDTPALRENNGELFDNALRPTIIFRARQGLIQTLSLVMKRVRPGDHSCRWIFWFKHFSLQGQS